jgi:aminoglycoside phosphotransferase (APT) family kinase protein
MRAGRCDRDKAMQTKRAPLQQKLQQQKISLSDLIDAEALKDWLSKHVPALGEGQLDAKLLHGGTSNAVIQITRSAATMILRRPPANPPPNSGKTMMREARILAALNGTRVPHPYLHASCDDPTVIGASFYVMDKIDGWSATLMVGDCIYPPPFNTGPDRYQLGFALVDGLVELAGVDYRSVGLEGLGKPDNFLERQADRWRQQLDGYAQKYPDYEPRKIPGLDYVADWLKANVPPMSPAAIIHGDYGSPNMIFAHDPPARIKAIVDWETSTIGDPLLDLGWLMYNLRDRDQPDVVPPSAYYNSTGFPTRQDIAEYYASKTGRDISNIHYYMVLAQFKLACIVEYKVAEGMSGRRGSEAVEMYGPMVINLIAEAERIARRSENRS